MATQSAADAAPLADRVRLHGEVHDVGAFCSRADLLILPSDFEGFPNALLEAWSHGCAALVSDRSDLPQLVRHGETGWVFPLDEPDGLRIALRRLLEGGVEPLRAAGLAGYREVQDRYSIEAVGARWHDLLSGVVA